MNFNSHQNELLLKIENALTKNKKDMLKDFTNILTQAKTLYKSDVFDFWLRTIVEVDSSEIPMTKYGYDEAVHQSKFLKNANRNQFHEILSSICERLFTYSTEDEMCTLQSNFHFYYSLKDTAIFKSSELGSLEGAERIEKGDYRIAYVTELNLKKLELYL